MHSRHTHTWCILNPYSGLYKRCLYEGLHHLLLYLSPIAVVQRNITSGIRGLGAWWEIQSCSVVWYWDVSSITLDWVPALCAHVSAFVCLSRVAVIDGPSELKYLDCYGGDPQSTSALILTPYTLFTSCLFYSLLMNFKWAGIYRGKASLMSLYLQPLYELLIG